MERTFLTFISAIRKPLRASRPVPFPPDNAYYTQGNPVCEIHEFYVVHSL